MTILSQSFFTLVSRHFMTLMLLSVWHSGKILWINTLFILLFLHVHCESLCRLERGDVVLGNDNGCVLRNIASSLLCSLLQDEATEATQIYILLLDERLLNNLHKSLYALQCLGFVNTCLFANLVYNFRFCHFFIIFLSL